MFALTPFGAGRSFSPVARRNALKEFDDLFNALLWAPDLGGSRNFREYEMYEKDGKLFLSVDAPGINPDDLEIRTSKDRVSIKCKSESEEKSETQDGDKTWYSKKTFCGFNYEVALPFEIDTDKAEASFEHGVIRIVAPRLQVSESKVLTLKKA